MAGAVNGTAEAFDLLANETRLDIIRTLGEAMGDVGDSPMAFSALQRRVGVQDNGKFNYHLQKLEGRLVEHSDAGYSLRPPGINVYQTLISGSLTGGVTVDRTPVEGESCPACHAGIDVWYEDFRFHLGCQECDELGVRYPIPAQSFDPDDPNSLLAAGGTWILRDQISMRRGLCPYCAGRVTGSLTGDREPMDEVGHEAFETMAQFVCQRCNWSIYADLPIALNSHPAVVSFHYENGVNLFEHHPWADISEVDERVCSTDPWRVTITYAIGDDELSVTVDEWVRVIEVASGRTGYTSQSSTDATE